MIWRRINFLRTLLFRYGLILLTGTCLFVACQTYSDPAPRPGDEIALIPIPQQMQKGEGHFTLQESTTISLPTEAANWDKAALGFVDQIEKATGVRLSITSGLDADIVVVIDEEIVQKEGYRMAIDTDKLRIAAQNKEGAFYAFQTLLQLLPAEVFAATPTLRLPLSIPVVDIEDAPRFSYRGMHLDVGRHFFDTDEIKQFIDLMALHKYNTFHWHLTEDQGWRIEIKQYPKLTEVGGFRKETLVGHYSDQPHRFDGKRYGGFYTQEEVKEIVAYAQDRFITIIPEIELPGHAQAAIAAYPELGCAEQPLEVMKVWGVSDNVYCPTEETFTFLENVIDEVAALFPAPYFHIGGDECPKTQWEESAFCQQLIKKEGLKDEHELQSYFIQRIEKVLNDRGKRLIGWDEILEGGLAPDATVMSWRGMGGGIQAAEEGHDVIMTPTDYCYLDYYQSQGADEPLAIGGFLPIEKVYAFDPIPKELAEDKQHHVLGAQANIWTEYIPTAEHLFYMAYPRASAMAEVLWSDPAEREFTDFSKRLIPHFARLEAAGISPAYSFFDPTGNFEAHDGEVRVSLANKVPGPSTIRYTLDGTAPTAQSAIYDGPLIITKTSKIKATTFLEDKPKGKSWSGMVQWHQAVGKDIHLQELPAEKYGTGGAAALINGVLGSEQRFGDKEWLGFEGKDLEAVIDMGELRALKEVNCRFFQDKDSWVFFPAGVAVEASTDGVQYSPVGSMDSVLAAGSAKVVTITLPLNENTKARYLKIKALNYGIIPNGYAGAGYPAWLFAGEMVIN